MDEADRGVTYASCDVLSRGRGRRRVGRHSGCHGQGRGRRQERAHLDTKPRQKYANAGVMKGNARKGAKGDGQMRDKELRNVGNGPV